MKVRDLINVIQCSMVKHPDLLDWDVFIQTIDDSQDRKKNNWETIKDGEDWEYIKCKGWNTFFKREKIFTINADF